MANKTPRRKSAPWDDDTERLVSEAVNSVGSAILKGDLNHAFNALAEVDKRCETTEEMRWNQRLRLQVLSLLFRDKRC